MAHFLEKQECKDYLERPPLSLIVLSYSVRILRKLFYLQWEAHRHKFFQINFLKNDEKSIVYIATNVSNLQF